MPLPTAEEIITLLSLSPHPEGGFFRQTHADSPLLPTTSTAPNDSFPTSLSVRPGSTLIYYLLPYPAFSSLHRIDAPESWHYYLGTCPLEIVELDPDLPPSATSSTPLRITTLGTDLLRGERPQHVVEKGKWFGARLPEKGVGEGDYVLVGCGVAPGFVFEGGGFEMGRVVELREVFERWRGVGVGDGKGEVGSVVRGLLEGMCRE